MNASLNLLRSEANSHHEGTSAAIGNVSILSTKVVIRDVARVAGGSNGAPLVRKVRVPIAPVRGLFADVSTRGTRIGPQALRVSTRALCQMLAVRVPGQRSCTGCRQGCRPPDMGRCASTSPVPALHLQIMSASVPTDPV
jgi:hypothetical protein